MRFAHTGEVLGLPGQTIAGVATAGSVVLVWTGIALALRRGRVVARRGARLAGAAVRSRMAENPARRRGSSSFTRRGDFSREESGMTEHACSR